MISNKRLRNGPIALLIVDDSLVFRRFLCDVFSDKKEFIIVGEAQDGIEALELVLKVDPDVILLDLEMPVMDGQTTLQHLMIHRPTPTIVFSSLTSKGTPRCFDTLKNGAIDFLCKDFIFQQQDLEHKRTVLVNKVKNAAGVHIRAREPIMARSSQGIKGGKTESRVIFCEDCGNREVVSLLPSHAEQHVTCSECGDQIDLVVSTASQYRRNSSLTIFGGGEGALFNLLEIIPKLNADTGGAFLVVLQEEVQDVKEFSEYLDAISPINVLKAREGLHVESGNCYLIAGSEQMAIKPYSAQVTLQKFAKGSSKDSVYDILLASASTIFKKQSAGIVLSGSEDYGDRGMAILLKNGGRGLVLDPDECFSKNSVQCVKAANQTVRTRSTPEIIRWINELDSRE